MRALDTRSLRDPFVYGSRDRHSIRSRNQSIVTGILTASILEFGSVQFMNRKLLFTNP